MQMRLRAARKVNSERVKIRSAPYLLCWVGWVSPLLSAQMHRLQTCVGAADRCDQRFAAAMCSEAVACDGGRAGG
jgi:hypothetical protein